MQVLIVKQSYYQSVRVYIPDVSSIWITGHSLGGALASLTALITNSAAITFASPGELLYAYRMKLIPGIDYAHDSTEDKMLKRHGPYRSPKRVAEIVSEFPIYNFGNDRDPIFNATCRGALSLCYWMGYILESKCHIGSSCKYSCPPCSLGLQVC